MNTNLFNIYQKAQQVYEMVVTQGPTALRTAADAIHNVESLVRQAADYLDHLNGVTQFYPGTQTEVQDYLGKLGQLKGRCEAELQKSAAPQGAQNIDFGALDWKSMILQILVQVINQLLTKTQASPAFQAAFGQQGQAHPDLQQSAAHPQAPQAPTIGPAPVQQEPQQQPVRRGR